MSSSGSHKRLFGPWLSIVLSAMLAIADVGCGTWAGNSEEPTKDPGTQTGTTKKSMIKLSFLGSTTGTTLLASTIDVIGAGGTSIGQLSLTDAKVALSEIKFKTDGGELDEAEFTGPYIVDLLSNQMSPDPGSIEVNAGTYKDIILKLHKLEQDEGEKAGVDSEDPVINNSIYLKGSYTATNGVVKPFELSYEIGEEFSLAPTTGVKGMNLEAGVTQAMIIAFRLDSWFRFDNKETNETAIDFSNISTDSIVLDKDASGDTAQKIRETIKENIKQSADFGKDDDDDGKLEPDESQKGED